MDVHISVSFFLIAISASTEFLWTQVPPSVQPFQLRCAIVSNPPMDLVGEYWGSKSTDGSHKVRYGDILALLCLTLQISLRNRQHGTSERNDRVGRTKELSEPFCKPGDVWFQLYFDTCRSLLQAPRKGLNLRPDLPLAGTRRSCGAILVLKILLPHAFVTAYSRIPTTSI